MALVIGPIIVATISGAGLAEFDRVGGVGRYVLWAITAGTLAGFTVGSIRYQGSLFAEELGGGLVVAEIFVTQFLIFQFNRAVPLGAIAFVIVVGFLLGWFFGPPMASGLKRSLPDFDGWLRIPPESSVQ